MRSHMARGVRRRITPSSTRFFGQNFTPSPSITFIEFSNKEFTKNCLKLVNIGQEITYFKIKISKFSRPKFFSKLWTVLFLSLKFFSKKIRALVWKILWFIVKSMVFCRRRKWSTSTTASPSSVINHSLRRRCWFSIDAHLYTWHWHRHQFTEFSIFFSTLILKMFCSL